MARVSEEQVNRAKEVNILDYMLAYEPHNLVRQGPGRYVLRDHDSFVISNGKWRWNSRQYGRNTAMALGYLIDVRGMGFVEAVETLAGERAAEHSYQEAAKVQQEPQKYAFHPPRSLRYPTKVVAYLQDRGIHSDIISRCLRGSILCESRYYNPGSPYHNAAVCVFMGKDEAGAVKFAAMRGIECDMKQDKAGSDKRFNFCLPPENPGSRQLAVFESPIDALSHASLQWRNGWQWDGYRLSLGGTSDTALISFLERNPQITRVILHLDNDAPGITAARRIKTQIAADSRFRHIRMSVNPPRKGKDYNEALLYVIAQERGHKLQRRREAAISI